VEFYGLFLHVSHFFPFGWEKMRDCDKRFQLYDRWKFGLRGQRRIVEFYDLRLHLSRQLCFERNQVRGQCHRRLFYQFNFEHPEQE